jgi:hypothetical protein
VTPRVGRDGATTRRQVLHQVEALIAEPHADHAQPQPEHALQALVRLAGDLDVEDPLEAEHAGVEGGRSLGVGHRQADGTDRAHRPGAAGGRAVDAEQGRGQHEDEGDVAAHVDYPSRRARWSPTRSALAMMVRAGFTAALDGKKEASTT